MNLLDIGLIALLVIPALVGVFKGLVNMATAFVGIWAAFLLAPMIRRLLLPHLVGVTGSEELASVFGYGAGFALTLISVGFVGWLVTRSLQKLDLQWANRLSGMALGLVSGLLIGGVGVAALQTVDPQSPLLAESTLAPPIGSMTQFLIAIAPEQAGDGKPEDAQTAPATPAPEDEGQTSARSTPKLKAEGSK